MVVTLRACRTFPAALSGALLLLLLRVVGSRSDVYLACELSWQGLSSIATLRFIPMQERFSSGLGGRISSRSTRSQGETLLLLLLLLPRGDKRYLCSMKMGVFGG